MGTASRGGVLMLHWGEGEVALVGDARSGQEGKEPPCNLNALGVGSSQLLPLPPYFAATTACTEHASLNLWLFASGIGFR